MRAVFFSFIHGNSWPVGVFGSGDCGLMFGSDIVCSAGAAAAAADTASGTPDVEANPEVIDDDECNVDADSLI